MKLNEFIFESKVKLLETRTPDQILMELNVINTDDIQKYLTSISNDLHTDDLKKWFIDRGKKYLINSEDANTVITQFSADAEPWMKKAQKRGDTLYRFMPSPDLRTKLDHVVDYLNALSDTVTGVKQADQQSQSRAAKAMKGLRNASMAQAIEASEKWTQQLNVQAQKKQERGEVSAQDEEGLEVVLTHGDLTWVKLTQKNCLDREGQVMGHCVASYWDRVKTGSTTIYSLRDPQNNPHATVEVRDGQLIQVKGKQNSPPVAKYQPATIKLLNTLDVPPNDGGRSDIQRMGFMFNSGNNKYGTILDVGYKIYNKNNITVYTMSKEVDRRTIPYIFLDGKQVTTKSDESYSYRMNVMDGWEAFADLDIAGSDPDAEIMDRFNKAGYKLAKFLSNIGIHKEVASGYRLPISEYMLKGDDGVIALPEDTLSLVTKIKDGYNLLELYKNPNPSRKGEFITLQNKEPTGGSHSIKYDEETNIIDTFGGYTRGGYGSLNYVDAQLLNKYFEKLPKNKKPKVQAAGLTKDPTTGDIVAMSEIAQKMKPVYKSGPVGFYEGEKTAYSREGEEDKTYKHIILVNSGLTMIERLVYGYDGKPGQGEWDVYQTSLDKNVNIDEEQFQTDEQCKGFCDVVNKMGLLQFFTTNAILDKLDDYGVFYNEEAVKFTTDADDLGTQYSDEKENGFSAKKTQKTLKMYFDDNLILDIKLYEGNTIGTYEVLDQVSVFENSKKIADVLNFYKLKRGDRRDYGYNTPPGRGDTNKNITASGISYTKDGEWKGTNQSPKQPKDLTKDEKVINFYADKDYTIHKFKNNWLVKDKESKDMIATLVTKGRREDKEREDGGTYSAIVRDIEKVEFNSSTPTQKQIEQVVDAMTSLGWDDTQFGVPDGSRFGYAFKLDGKTPSQSSRDDYTYKGKDDFLLDVDDVLFRQGKYVNNMQMIADMPVEEDRKVVSKGPGGTWVQERYSPADYSIRYVLNDIAKLNGSYTSRDKMSANDTFILNKLGDELPLSPIENGFTLYSQKQPVLRVKENDGYSGRKYLFYKLSEYDADSKQAYKVEALTDESIKEWMPQIERLINSTYDPNREVSMLGLSNQLKDMGYFMSGGKLQNLQDDPKLKGFMDGQITYEDGSQWVKSDTGYYSGTFNNDRRGSRELNWILKRPDSEGNLKDVIAVAIGGGGLNTIQFATGMRERTTVYRAFLNDIMDISDKVYHG